MLRGLVLLLCASPSISATNNVRLVDGSEPWMGRVEVNVHGEWGTVCDDDWDEADARVVCRELGYDSTAATAHDLAFFGAGSGSIYLDDVICQGEESSIWDCPASSVGVTNCDHGEDAGVTCVPGSGAQSMNITGTTARFESTTSMNWATTATVNVRLVDGSEPWMGRVEVKYNGEWGTVCDDHWDETDARVVCRELGYDSTAPTVHDTRVFGPGFGSIYLDNVRCEGDESSIWDCPANSVGDTDCNHGEDVGVSCVPGSGAQSMNITGTTPRFESTTSRNWATTPTTNVRLVGGSEPWMGRVEVKYNGEWGTVCDDNWEEANARVVCRELGYDSTAPTVHPQSMTKPIFGTGSGYIYLDEVDCQGDESSIWDCPASSVGDTDCYHSEDVGVSCVPATINVRLVGGSEPWMGRVEVKYNGEWGTVCDDNWGEANARVVCRELGYDSTAPTVHPQTMTKPIFGTGSGYIYLDEVDCQGDESSIWDCPASSVGVTDCYHSEDVGVSCVPGSGAQSVNIPGTTARFESTTSRNWGTTPTNTPDSTVRLVGGDEPWMGRVEVNVNGEWGTVCDDDWDDDDARVVCRELGYDSAVVTAHKEAFFGKGNGSIQLDDVSCYGNESSIWDCPASSVGQHNCVHMEDAGVTCRPATDTTDSTVRLVGGSEPWMGRVEVNVNGDWGTVCDDGWDETDARVVCRELGYDSSSEAFTFGNGSGSIHLDNVRCRGDESSIWDCPASPVGSHNCKHSEDAGVSCRPVHTVVRLVGGSQPWMGRVEVSINGEWGTVCDDDWDETDARVVCRQLGFNSTTVTAHGSAFFGQGCGSTLLDDVNCQGSEISISECPATGQGDENCDHSEDAGVTCGAAP